MRPVAALFGVVLIVAGLGIGFGWFARDTSSADARLAGTISSVRIDGNSGDVRIRTGSEPRLRETYHSWSGKPDVAHSMDDGELVLGDCGWWCSVDYDVVVPPGTTVTGDSDSGTVLLDGVASVDVAISSGNATVRDVAGDVQLDGSSGNVEVHRIGGALDADLSSGAIRGDGLAGPVTVDASSGDVDLTLDRPNDVSVDVSSGNVRLRLPRGDYDIDADSGSGNRRVDLPNVPGAENTVEAAAGSGNVLVTGA